MDVPGPMRYDFGEVTVADLYPVKFYCGRLCNRDKIRPGRFGNVFRCNYGLQMTQIAAKQFPTLEEAERMNYGEDYRDMILKRVRDTYASLAGCRHPNLVNLYGMLIDEASYYKEQIIPRGFLMEFYENTVYSWIHTNRDYNEKTIVRWSFQGSQALSFLHDRELIHRDVTTKTMFIHNGNDIKLGKFDLCHTDDEKRRQNQNKIGYVPPEVVYPERYNIDNNKSTLAHYQKRGDSYMLAVCIFELYYRSDIMRDTIENWVNEGCKALETTNRTMQRLLIKNLDPHPGERSAMEDVIRYVLQANSQPLNMRRIHVVPDDDDNMTETNTISSVGSRPSSALTIPDA